MPQYYVGHRQRIEQIAAAAARLPGLYFCGNAFDGVGIPFCIRSGEQAAERVLAQLRGEEPAAAPVGQSADRARGVTAGLPS